VSPDRRRCSVEQPPSGGRPGWLSDPTGQDKNHLSSVRVFDAHLGLVSTVQRFNLYNTPLSAAVRQLQVDPSTRTGWFVGPLQQQVAVFPY